GRRTRAPRLGALAELTLHFRVGDEHERPRLLVGSRGRGAGGADRVLDELEPNRLGGEAADGAPRLQHREEGARALEGRILGGPLVLERNGPVLHVASLAGAFYAVLTRA